MLHSCRVDGGSSRTSVSIHGLGYLLTALRRQGLIPDELVLQVATFLRSHDLFLELRVRTPRTLTANQVRQGGKQGTDGRERSRIHFSACRLPRGTRYSVGAAIARPSRVLGTKHQEFQAIPAGNPKSNSAVVAPCARALRWRYRNVG
jgi:hypothetical protein